MPPHSLWVTIMERNKALYPIGIRLLGADAIVLKSNFIAHLLKQFCTSGVL